MGVVIKTDLEFGEEYEDIITGFKGKCTGIVKHQFGCIRGLLQPPVDKDGKRPDGEWFDEQQIKGVAQKKKTTGGPMPAPKKRKDP